MSRNSPPKLLLRFFRWFCHPDYAEDIEGDLTERFEKRMESKNRNFAKWKLLIDVLQLFRPGIMRPIEGFQKLNNIGNMKHQILISWRFMLKNKGYSALNIGGLAIGMFIAITIGLWLNDELSFNKYHSNYHRIAKVMANTTRPGEIETNGTQVTGLGTLLASEYGNQFKHVAMVRQRIEQRVLAAGELKFTQPGYFMQPEGPHIFSLKMLQGTRDGLSDLKSILLSKSLATKLFADKDPINQVVTMDNQWQLLVTGVYEDLPKNSEFSAATYFAPLDLYLQGWSHLNVWDNFNIWVFVEIHEKTNFAQVSETIKDAMLPHIDSHFASSSPSLFLHPMKEWHLSSTFENGVPVLSTRLKFVWIYGAVGVFVLILACINFINLSTANSEKRAKEIGIRKAIGSGRKQLISQFLWESSLISLASAAVALVVTYLLLPMFNHVSGKELTLPFDNPIFWLLILGVTLATSLLAGSYPAFYLSSFAPTRALKNSFQSPGNQLTPRKVLVVFQFTISIAFVIGAMIFQKQVEHVKDRPAGYSKERLIALRPGAPEYFGKYHTLREGLLKTGLVEEIAETNYETTSSLGWSDGFKWKDQPQGKKPAFNTTYVTHEYGKTIDWKILQGRDFSRDISSDAWGVVINESAAKLIGIQNPVGEILEFEKGKNKYKKYKILGVTKDQIKGSPFEKAFPAITFLSENDLSWLLIKIKPNIKLSEAIPGIANAFNKIIPTAPFDFKFVDEEYNMKFQEEERIARLAGLSAILAVFISCLGLFGLVSYVTERRTKEIGIRKILGASMLQIWRLLTVDFMALVAIASVITLPIMYFLAPRWLDQFYYRIDSTWPIYFTAITIAAFIAFITISIHVIRTALLDPVKSLKNE